MRVQDVRLPINRDASEGKTRREPTERRCRPRHRSFQLTLSFLGSFIPRREKRVTIYVGEEEGKEERNTLRSRWLQKLARTEARVESPLLPQNPSSTIEKFDGSNAQRLEIGTLTRDTECNSERKPVT